MHDTRKLIADALAQNYGKLLLPGGQEIAADAILAALDAFPPEKVVGYAIEFPWGIASGYFDTAEAARKEASGVSDGRFRIVKLVEVPDQ